jgi:microcystin-dependent protein
MASVYRYYENPPAHQIGDTKMSSIAHDHAGWMLCDGRLLDKEYYKFLHNIIGDAFGENEEGTHFRIPNGSGRVAAAIGSAGPGMNDWKMGDMSGEEMHQLTIAEMPAHKHGSLDVSGNMNGDGVTGTSGSEAESEFAASGSGVKVAGSNVHQHTIGSTGGSQPHNTIQPTIYVGNMFIYGGF